MIQWTKIKTALDIETSIGLRDDGQPVVSTRWNGYEPTRLESRDHGDEALAAIDNEYGLWCKGSDRADAGDDGEEVWYPKLVDQQPTHWLKIDGKRVASVLPVGDGCEPEELIDNSALSTRLEWLEGISPSYSLRDSWLCCHGALVVGSWRIDPIER